MRVVVCACVRSCATDSRTGKQVAIKKLSNLFCDLDASLRVLREVRLITRLKHNNVRGFLPLLPVHSCGCSRTPAGVRPRLTARVSVCACADPGSH